MSLHPVWRTRLVALGAAVVAIWVGSSVANAELGWPGVVAGALGLLLITVIQPIPTDALLLGLVVIGYIAGNRGFAQLSLTPNLPLLPAEFVLLVAGAIVLFRSARQRELPVRRDLLNAAILLWIAVSSIRLYHDIRTFGVIAIRDYATVYYAAFFFLAQSASANPRGRRFIEQCVLVGSTLLAVIFPLFVRFPDVFINRLAIHGVPVIYFKGDLAGTFLAVGSVLFYVRYEASRSALSLAACLLFAAGTITTNNRASMLSLVAATVVLAAARRWRFAAIQVFASVMGAAVLLFAAYLQHQTWRETPLYGLYERVVSVVDPQGRRTYSAESAEGKGDNNQYRLVWWQTVVEDTFAGGPITGLGYGYDIAEHFVQEYYADPGEEFTTRSPHNVLLSVFARTGFLGLVPFLWVVVLVFSRALRAGRDGMKDAAPWLVACAIFVSACFGVVLEGPMGAVVFWIVLGVANASAWERRQAAPAEAPVAATVEPAPTP